MERFDFTNQWRLQQTECVTCGHQNDQEPDEEARVGRLWKIQDRFQLKLQTDISSVLSKSALFPQSLDEDGPQL